MANALQVAQDFADAVGFPRPSTLVGNTNDDPRQVLRLLNQVGKELASRHKWQKMNFEATFTTLAAESQGDLPTIIGATQVLKSIINDTIWNRTTRLKVYGPLAAQQWQAEKALTTTGPFPQFRVRGNLLMFNPVPTAGQTCYFEYASKCWCTDVGGTIPRVAIAADTDVFLVDDDLLSAGLEWRWLKKKGLEYAEEFQQYEYLVKNAIVDEKPRATLQMDGEAMRYTAGVVVPIGSWPL
jgi:hypothetical protein